jgi:hypothetical protein
MERHVYQGTGGRTNTGCLEIRIVEWSDMSTSELEEEQTLVVSESG